MSDVLIEPAPRRGFIGAKPDAWTRWVLASLCFDARQDDVVDLFHGSGSVSAVVKALLESAPTDPVTDP